MKIGGVYTITNTKKNKRYVGSTTSFSARWSRHKYDLRRRQHKNILLQNAWNKYKESDFVFEIAEVVTDRKILREVEQRWFDKIKPVYNVNRDATRPPALRGKDNPFYGDHRFAGKNNPMFGRRHSLKTKRLWSIKRKNVVPWNKGLKGAQVAWNKGLSQK